MLSIYILAQTDLKGLIQRTTKACKYVTSMNPVHQEVMMKFPSLKKVTAAETVHSHLHHRWDLDPLGYTGSVT